MALTQTVAQLALDMCDSISEHTFLNCHRVSFRAGINSGAIIAHMIDRRKFVYDVRGHGENVASCTKSHGLGAVVQNTEATYQLIKDGFVCEPHGTVNVKSKRDMHVWLVVSAKLAEVANAIL